MISWKVFASCSHNCIFHWPRGLSPRGRNASTRRYNNDSTELEVKTAAQPLWASHACESTGKEVTVLAGVTDPDYHGETGLLLHSGGKETMSVIQEIP